MDEIKEYIFQIDSDLVKEYYSHSENIKVLDCNNSKSGLCVIYFSSNELYFPNTEASFKNAIVDRDKYEWQNNLFPGASRHIFVRDIQKQWYIEGVSSKYNTPSLLAKKLSELCSQNVTYTIGSSAGGFAAILFGSILGARKIFAFNAQMDLNILMSNSNSLIDPLLFKHSRDEQMSKYFKVSNFLNADLDYFYFQSAKSRFDVTQYNACSKKELITKIEFSTSNHGFPFLRHDLKFVLSLHSEQLKTLALKKIHPFTFSIQIHGLFRASRLALSAVRNRIRKKIKERMHARNINKKNCTRIQATVI